MIKLIKRSFCLSATQKKFEKRSTRPTATGRRPWPVAPNKLACWATCDLPSSNNRPTGLPFLSITPTNSRHRPRYKPTNIKLSPNIDQVIRTWIHLTREKNIAIIHPTLSNTSDMKEEGLYESETAITTKNTFRHVRESTWDVKVCCLKIVFKSLW